MAPKVLSKPGLVLADAPEPQVFLGDTRFAVFHRRQDAYLPVCRTLAGYYEGNLASSVPITVTLLAITSVR